MNTGQQLIPWDFLEENATITPRLISDGIRWTYLQPSAAVYLGERLLGEGDKHPAVLELASLSYSAIVPDIEGLLAQLIFGTSNSTTNTWLMLLIKWVHENRDRIENPFEQLGLVCADFRYPEALSEVCFRYSSGTSDFWQRIKQLLDSGDPFGDPLLPD